MHTRRTGTWGIILAVVLIIAGTIGGLVKHHPHARSPISPIPNLPDNVEMRLDHVTFRGLSNGKIVWEMTADHFDFSKDRMTFRVGGLQKMTLLRDGKQELTLSADALERNTLTGDLSIQGNVNIAGDRIALQAPSVHWNDQQQCITIPGTLSATFGDVKLTAEDGAVYDVGHATFRSDGRITADIRGNTLHAGAAMVDIGAQRLMLGGPAEAVIRVADAEGWMGGQQLPAIPPIPQSVKDRYAAYLQRQPRR